MSTSSKLIEMLNQLNELDDVQHEQFVICCDQFVHATPEDIVTILDVLLQYAEPDERTQRLFFDPILARLSRWQRGIDRELSDDIRQRILLLYRHLGDLSPCRWRLLQWLTVAATAEDLHCFVRQVCEDPPQEPQSAALVFTPLFQRADYDVRVLFPQLLEGMKHPSIATPILDLCNYLVRSEKLTTHPASDRVGALAILLGNLVQHLLRFEESSDELTGSAETIGEKVDECVALIVALCDAVALIGDTSVVGKLNQAMQLGHRRIRTAAAAALARLGDSNGIDSLVELASEPVARLRVLASAEELGISDKIAPEYRTEGARAEANVALELAQPNFFGIPPSRLELIDSRTLYWPSFEQPVDCYLIQFTYQFDSAHYTNVAIAGPLVHTFAADLNDLPPEDIYAAYAGWHAEHESLYETPLYALTDAQRVEITRLERRLHDAGYQVTQSISLGHFFGERVLVAQAGLEHVNGTAIVDQHGIEWYPQRTRKNPIGPHEAYCIYKGRRLLRSFNP